MPEIVLKLLSISILSDSAFELKSEQNNFSQTGRVDLNLQLCTGFNLEHGDLFLCHYFNQRPMNDPKIKRIGECSFGW